MLFVYFSVNLVLMSLVEYALHRWVMHRPWPWRHSYYVEHALAHHGFYYRRFNHEPDPIGRVLNVDLSPRIACCFLAPLSVLCLLSVPYYLTLCAVALGHALVWTAIHREMHQERRQFFCGMRLYRFLARYHFLHHRQPHKNFNVVLPPLGDLIFGTRAVATEKDEAAWQAIEAAR
jgi:hypothetical protein